MSTERDVCAALDRAGVRAVFGLPAAPLIPLYDALRDARLRTVNATHELGAAFMANGYARATGEVGVVAATPGPGLAYTAAAVAEARADSAPLLVVTTEARADPVSGAVSALAKTTVRAGPATAAAATRDALDRAAADEPGPVVLELCAADRPATPPASADDADADASVVAELAAMLRAAKLVALLVGQGAADAAAEVVLLAERLGAAVLATTSGRGVVPEDHPLVVASDVPGGRAAAASRVVAEADVVLALGCKLSSNAIAAGALRLPPGKLLRVDTADGGPAARLTVTARVEDVLPRLLPLVEDARGWPPESLEAARKLSRRERTLPEPMLGAGLVPAQFFAALRRALPREALLVLDSGLHQYLARRHFDVLTPRGLIAPVDFQSMGFGLPAAIGARIARPAATVVALVGDGGLAMSGLELLTAVRERLDLVVLVLDDGALGLIRLQQLARRGREHATRQTGPDVSALADATGAAYRPVGTDAERTLREALGAGGVTLVHVPVVHATGRALAWRGRVVRRVRR